MRVAFIVLQFIPFVICTYHRVGGSFQNSYIFYFDWTSYLQASSYTDQESQAISRVTADNSYSYCQDHRTHYNFATSSTHSWWNAYNSVLIITLNPALCCTTHGANTIVSIVATTVEMSQNTYRKKPITMHLITFPQLVAWLSGYDRWTAPPSCLLPVVF